jgi:uncharacterized Zn-binding protein involved in type VI secretion
MLPAARLTDLILSPLNSGTGVPAPLPIVAAGAPTVLIGGLPAARMGDTCGADVILMGSMTVLIGGAPAARLADPSVGGGAVIGPGAPTVMIGG